MVTTSESAAALVEKRLLRLHWDTDDEHAPARALDRDAEQRFLAEWERLLDAARLADTPEASAAALDALDSAMHRERHDRAEAAYQLGVRTGSKLAISLLRP